jgi:RNA polymerase sigma factor (sigma-70 family)
MLNPHTRLTARLVPAVADDDLLARFARDRDESAFAALVHRHGPIVLGVCRRVLGHPADADDAFQAVFLVLANRADSLVGQRALGGWLHGVAVRVAMQARLALARRRKHERAAAERRPESALDPTPAEPSWIDRELSAMPDKFREPVVLCLLQDRPRAEVAAELGIPEGTLASRLDTARKRLANRLARHRVPLVLTGLLASVPATLADAAVRRAADNTDTMIHHLANEVTRSMLTNAKWRVLLAAGILTAAVGGLLLAAPAPTPTPTAPRPAPVPEPKVPKWKQEFDKFYTLKDDELVKVIPRSERPDCRRDFLREWLISEEEVKPDRLDKAMEDWERTRSFVIEIDSKGKRGRTRHDGSLRENPPNGTPKEIGTTIFGLTYSIAHVERYELVSDPRVNKVMFLDMPDIVVRSDAPREKLIPALDKALHEKLKTRFEMEWKEVEKEVWVVSGKLDLKPRAWLKAGQVDVYSDEVVVDKSEEGQAKANPVRKGKGGVSALLKNLQYELQTWVLWAEGDPPATPEFEWTSHWRKVRDEEEWKAAHDPEKVLPNVSEQTGLTFKKEKRKVPVLVLSLRKAE